MSVEHIPIGPILAVVKARELRGADFARANEHRSNFPQRRIQPKAGRSLGPVQNSTPPDIRKTNHQDEDETHHHPKTVPTKFMHLYRPGIHENDLNIEENEDHRYEVEPNAKSLLCIPGADCAAFKWLVLHFGVSLWSKEDTQDEYRDDEHRGDDEEN